MLSTIVQAVTLAGNVMTNVTMPLVYNWFVQGLDFSLQFKI